MKRENRYIVFKISDIYRYLPHHERWSLKRLIRLIDNNRKADGKPSLECAVVEKDWPEYEPTWRAVEARVDGVQSDMDRLIEFAAAAAVEDTDVMYDLWRSLPEYLREAINQKEKELMEE